MEVEEVRASRGRFQQGDRFTPKVVLRLADGEIVAASEPREIGGRNQAAPSDIFEVSRKLCPERRLERDLLAHRDDAEIGKRCLNLSGAGIDFLELARELIGERGTELFSDADMAAVRSRLGEVSARIAAREEEIGALLAADRPTVVEVPDVPGPAEATDDTELSEEAAQ